MRYHQSTTQYNCGIDLHARSMYVCVVDRQGDIRLHQNIEHNDFDFFLKRIQPFRHDLTITAECMFAWYWLADACAREHLPFVLAHALYLRAIHGGKNKNDRIDSEKLARLLAAHLIPIAYVYPAARRPVRALLRQRLTYVWRRSELLRRIQSMQQAEGLVPVPRCQSRHREPWEARLVTQFPNAHHQLALQTDLATIRHAQEPHRLRPRPISARPMNPLLRPGAQAARPNWRPKRSSRTAPPTLPVPPRTTGRAGGSRGQTLALNGRARAGACTALAPPSPPG